jgi:hypothetical protein
VTRARFRAARHDTRDAGAVTPFVMLLCVALTALLGLVVDGGRALSAREKAFGEAEQAARAGAAQLSAASLRGGSTVVQVGRATAAAESFMTASGHPGSVAVMGSTVVATVRTFMLPTPLLALVGIDEIRISASASATAVAG